MDESAFQTTRISGVVAWRHDDLLDTHACCVVTLILLTEWAANRKVLICAQPLECARLNCNYSQALLSETSVASSGLTIYQMLCSDLQQVVRTKLNDAQDQSMSYRAAHDDILIYGHDYCQSGSATFCQQSEPCSRPE